jgi:GPH family glycoside/pentoside/hexuronide:cation symporter
MAVDVKKPGGSAVIPPPDGAAAKSDEPARARSGRPSMREKALYGFGDFGNGFMFDLGQSYLTKFWIDVNGIGSGVVALIFSLTKIFDAFMDPLAASWIDSRKVGRRGKFRPVMMGGAVVLALVTIFTFTMPNLPMAWKIVWAIGGYAIWGVVYTFTNNPYQSMASVMSRNIEDRATMASSRQVGSLGAQWIVGFAFIPVLTMFGMEKRISWAMAALVMAAVGVLSFFICYKSSRERVRVNRSVGYERNSVKDYAKVVFTNRPLLGLVLMTLFLISAMNVNNMMMVFFAQYNLGNIGLQPRINLIMMGVSALTVLLIPKLVKRWGKKRIAFVGCLVGACANLVNFIVPTHLWSFIALVTIGYVGLAIPNGVTWAFVSDTIDYSEWHTGVRKETMVSAAFNFSRKIAQSLAALVGAGMLSLTGYVANQKIQSPETLAGIKGVLTLYPAIALVVGAVMLFFVYHLTDDKYKKIAGDLEAGRWEHGVIEDQIEEGEPDSKN